MPNLEAPVAVCVGGSYYDESTAVGRSNLMRMNYPGVVGRGERVLRNLIERQLFLGNDRRSLGDLSDPLLMKKTALALARMKKQVFLLWLILYENVWQNGFS